MIKNIWKQLIKLGFRLLYNELSWTYDLVSWLVSLGEWQSWQLAALPFVKGNRVLEIGHGPGHILAALDADGYEVFGLDRSRHMGRLARRHVSVPLVNGVVQKLPFVAAVFDTVVSTFPTEYITLPETVQSVYRVLSPGGHFVIVPEGHLTGNTPLHRLIDWLFLITGQRQGAYEVDDAHKWPQEDQWRPFEHLFQAAGFQVHVQQMNLARSAVTVVIAHKPEFTGETRAH